MKYLSIILSGLALTMSQAAQAVDSCGYETSPGNPYTCCPDTAPNGWWAWKKASDAKWAVIPTTAENTWDDAAAKTPALTASTTPKVGSIAVRESNPRCAANSTVGACTRFVDSGGLAYVEELVKDGSGTVTGVITSEMVCKVPPSGRNIIAKTAHPLTYFNSYVSPVAGRASWSGRLPQGTVCETDKTPVGIPAPNTIYKDSGWVKLYRSASCKTVWTEVTSTYAVKVQSGVKAGVRSVFQQTYEKRNQGWFLAGTTQVATTLASPMMDDTLKPCSAAMLWATSSYAPAGTPPTLYTVSGSCLP
jgi:hypothetical protein